MGALIMLTLWPLVSGLAAHHPAKEIDSETVYGPFAVTVSAVIPFNPRDPVVVVKYCNQGKLPFRIELPGNKREIELSRAVSLKIDDKEAETVVEPWILRLADIKPTRRVDLGPGETAELELPLAWIYKIPKDWKKLEIRDRWGPQGKVNGILIIER